MCLAVPARILDINGALAKVERKGVERDVSLMLLPDAKVGDYVLVHAGFAMEKISKDDSDITDALLAEMQGAPRTVVL